MISSMLATLVNEEKKKKKNDSRIIIMRHIEIGENVCGYTRAGGKNRSLTGRSIERGRIRFGSPEGNQNDDTIKESEANVSFRTSRLSSNRGIGEGGGTAFDDISRNC